MLIHLIIFNSIFNSKGFMNINLPVFILLIIPSSRINGKDNKSIKNNSN